MPDRIFSGARFGSIGPITDGPLCAAGEASAGLSGFKTNLFVVRPAGAIPPLEECEPPLTLTAAGSEAPLPAEFFPAPPLLEAPPPVPPFSFEPWSTPPGLPGCLPSGEIATRADRFPCGTLTSAAGGAGFAEIAISRCKFASPDADPTSGAAPFSACFVSRSAALDEALKARTEAFRVSAQRVTQNAELASSAAKDDAAVYDTKASLLEARLGLFLAQNKIQQLLGQRP